MQEYLDSSYFFDFYQPKLQAFADSATKDLSDPIAIACALYLAVRDTIRYDPYTFSSKPEAFQASSILETKASYCIPKAMLLGAAARYKKIPSRLGLADVVNHISDPAFVKKLQSNIFAMHGYIELFLENRWVKATPAFNLRLCQKFGVSPLEFNGRDDSVFQAFDTGGRNFMEYVADYGVFADLPLDFIISQLKKTYPHLAAEIDRGNWLTRD